MSTTFGVKVPSEEDLIEVAFQSSGIRWKNKLAALLPDATPVIAMDNDSDDIKTIGDIKQAIKEQGYE